MYEMKLRVEELVENNVIFSNFVKELSILLLVLTFSINIMGV